ncbi:MAG TPA: hypothetical protein VGW75_09760 [Solirubrobacteraceae bacterium]|nr:hypothetical protein [Solirubrobacteraceae bacterium]
MRALAAAVLLVALALAPGAEAAGKRTAAAGKRHAASAEPTAAAASATRRRAARTAVRWAAKRRAAVAKRASRRTAGRGWRAIPGAVAAPLAVPLAAPAPEPPAPSPDAAATAPEPAPAPPPEAPAAPLCDPSPWLGAVAEDVGGFRLRLTRTCVPAGTVLFQFRNTDLSSHNLWAEGVAPAAPPREIVRTTPGETAVRADAPLTAGRWRLYCSLPGHEAMSRLVDVTPAG